MLYLDTSAFLKLYVREAGSEAVQSLVQSQSHPLPVHDLLEMELTNALRLKVFWEELPREASDEQIRLFQERKRRGLYFTPEIHRADQLKLFMQLAEKTSEIGCRTMDILHVATALILEADAFVSFDSRQCQLAEASGLRLAEVEG